MKTAPIKVKYYISPKTFAEYYFKTSKKNMRRAELESRESLLWNFEKKIAYLDLQVLLNDDNDLILFSKERDSDNTKDFINLCSLPSDFFEILQKELPMTTHSRAFNQLARNIQQMFIAMILKNIIAQTFTRIAAFRAFRVRGSLYLRAESLNFDDFKQTKHFKHYDRLSIHNCFFEVFERLFNKNFYLEIDAIKTSFVVKVFDFRNNANIEYELLSYTLTDFEFLKHFHKDLAKIFVRDYFEHILYNNMQQILKGSKDEV